MTQSKNNDVIVLTDINGTTSTFDLNSIINTVDDVSLDFNNFNSGDITITGAADSTYTIGPIDTVSIDNIWTLSDNRIDPENIEKMCKEYPGLEKVWRNFKSVYDMCKQDYEGKKKAGEIDNDDLPF